MNKPISYPTGAASIFHAHATAVPVCECGHAANERNAQGCQHYHNNHKTHRVEFCYCRNTRQEVESKCLP